MKRSRIESKLRETQLRIKREIEASPIQAFFVGILLGVIVILLKGIFFPLIALSLVVLVACWFFAEKDSLAAFRFDERDINPPQPPSGFQGQDVPAPDRQEQS